MTATIPEMLAPMKTRATDAHRASVPALMIPTEELDALIQAIEAVVKVHEPIDAAMYSGAQQRMVQVCTGCGTDDGNWQRWPCPTVRALTAALGDER